MTKEPQFDRGDSVVINPKSDNTKCHGTVKSREYVDNEWLFTVEIKTGIYKGQEARFRPWDLE